MKINAKVFNKILASEIQQYIPLLCTMTKWIYLNYSKMIQLTKSSISVSHHIKGLKQKNHMISIDTEKIFQNSNIHSYFGKKKTSFKKEKKNIGKPPQLDKEHLLEKPCS